MASRRAVRKAAKAAKRHGGVVIAILVILVLVVAAGAVAYFKVDKVHDTVNELIFGSSAATNETNDGKQSLSGGAGSRAKDVLPKATTYGDDILSFHFLELGNNFTGDSTYIKAGDIDILIDAGSRQDSADAIAAYVDNYCTDGTLEFVIATHAHQDHIAGFTNTKTRDGIFKRYDCEIIIDFALTNATSAVYNNYVAARDEEIALDPDTHKHYTALDCCKGTNGAQQTYVLGESMTMTILYQRFYEEKTKDENNYSVCVLFNHGENYYLLTGDLEAEGEASLVESNELPEVQLFKAGHHGSYTASTNALLSVIKPKIVCVCCCAGAVEYTQNLARTFPSQEFIDRVAPYTERIYVTTVGYIKRGLNKNGEEVWIDGGFSSMNGDITVLSEKGKVTVTCSNNDTVLKDTDWFKANRTCPSAWTDSSG